MRKARAWHCTHTHTHRHTSHFRCTHAERTPFLGLVLLVLPCLILGLHLLRLNTTSSF